MAGKRRIAAFTRKRWKDPAYRAAVIPKMIRATLRRPRRVPAWETTGVKHCPACRKEKGLAEYWRTNGKPQVYCKLCLRAKNDTWYRAQKLRQWRAKKARCTECARLIPDIPRGRRRKHLLCAACLVSWTHADYRRRARLKVLAHYSGGTPRCACCKEHRLPFLSLDHVNRDGAAHRKALGGGPRNTLVLQWIVKHNYPPGFQVLCMNCNLASYLGVCPHKLER